MNAAGTSFAGYFASASAYTVDDCEPAASVLNTDFGAVSAYAEASVNCYSASLDESASSGVTAIAGNRSLYLEIFDTSTDVSLSSAEGFASMSISMVATGYSGLGYLLYDFLLIVDGAWGGGFFAVNGEEVDPGVSPFLVLVNFSRPIVVEANIATLFQDGTITTTFTPLAIYDFEMNEVAGARLHEVPEPSYAAALLALGIAGLRRAKRLFPRQS